MEVVNLSNVNRLLTVILLESGERHGYELMDRIEEITGDRPSSSHIYPFLSKLVEKGLLEERKEGRKKVYSLTEDGESFASEKVESFGEVIGASLLDQVEECENCGCEIYSGGFREEGKVFCCEHCASGA
ncbi:MAG: PadR family transcriptional regulator [Candidatus Nanosalina sp.]